MILFYNTAFRKHAQNVSNHWGGKFSDSHCGNLNNILNVRMNFLNWEPSWFEGSPPKVGIKWNEELDSMPNIAVGVSRKNLFSSCYWYVGISAS